MKRSSTVLAALLALLLVATNDAARHRKYRQTYQDIDSDDDDTSDVQITVFPSEKEVRDGRDVSFECRARTSDNSVYPTVRWARVGGPLPSSAHDSGGRLTINPVQLSDAGTYICVSDYNGNTVEARATLSVVSYGPQEVSNGLRQAGQCMADEKACGNNECVKNDYVCDGEPDCRDRSDEANCPAISRTCEPNEFKCNNNKCVQKMWLCDGDDDCGDNSDELNCNAKPSSSDCKPTEFQCHDRRQCVPSSFHCDGTNDCHDGSDEVGCVQPTVVDPPQTNLQVPRGTTFSLTCKAVAVPEPYINWRLNWGPVCEPPRCLQTSEGGYGTLTIHDAQPVDQGAYTCEAINVKGRVLATPDCIVRVVDDPRPQPPQPPTAPPQRASCDTRGAVTPYPNNYGTCECKSQVTGPNCDQCKPGAFHLSEKSPEGCLKCFCFGVSNDCRSSGHYRTKDRLMFAGDAEGVTISDIEERTIDRNTPFSFFKTGYLTFDGTTDGVAKYWRLPQRFLGDKVTAYGGKMEFEIEFSGSGHHSSEPMVVLKGNQNILVHRVRNQEHVLRSDSPVRITVETYETNYEQLNGAAATREDLLMVLADLDAFLIRATHVAHQTSTSLGDVSWEIAVDRYTPDGLALEVEQCVCPPGYLGTSCEDCAPGYERSGYGPYLGTCVPIQPRHQQCGPGAVAPTAPAQGQCQCKASVIGPNCDRCAPNSFGLAPTNPQGCIPCFCSGVTQQCSASSYRRTSVSIDYARGDRDQLELTTSDSRQPYSPQTRAELSGQAIEFRSFEEARGQTLYWKLPEKFLGDKVTSYGGTLEYTFKFSGNGNSDQSADVILRGNDIALQYKHREPFYADRENKVQIKIIETSWQRVDGQQATREHLLMTLADLDTLLIKSTYNDDCTDSQLLSANLEFAEPYGQGLTAAEVEQCICPPGYVGTSCEDCAPGYSRTGGGLYLGLCEKCECNGHASQCDKEYGYCLDCQHNTEGDQCERCKPGFVGDARRGTPNDCQPEATRAPCHCNNHSPRGCDSFGRCLLCEHNTEGTHCERCKKGYYGDATKGSPYDCTPCPCPGASDCYLDNEGQVACRICPAGLQGRLCNECAPGYTRSNKPAGRVCEPIGQVTNEDITFVQKPHEVLRVRIMEPKRQIALPGDRVHWICQVTGYTTEKIHVEWTKVGEMSLPPNAKAYDGYLVLKGVEAENAGQYRCTATTITQYATDDALLTISKRISGRPPQPVIDPPHLVVNEGEPAAFRCWVPGIPDCQITWHREQLGGPLPHGVYQTGNALKIPQSQLHHAGRYICSAANQYGTGQSPPAVLEVKKPVIPPKVDPIRQTVDRDQPARFKCWVPGNSNVQLRWSRPGGAPLPSGVQEQQGILHIPRASDQEVGQYVCTATDPSDNTPLQSEPVQLNIRDPAPPQRGAAPQIDPPNQTVNVNDPAQFRCWVPGQPRAQLKWSRKDGRPLPNGILERDGFLRIDKSQLHDAGEYECTSTEPDGSTQLSPPARLNVNQPQAIQPQVDPPVQTVNEGEPSRIRCWVPGHPNIQLQFVKRGRRPLPAHARFSQGNLEIPRTLKSDEDEYICIATDPTTNRPVESNPARVIVKSQGTPPRPVATPPLLSVAPGSPARFNCVAHSDTPARIRWGFREENGPLPEHVNQDGDDIVISEAGDRNVGEYVCSATNDFGTGVADPVRLEVTEDQEPPTAVVEPRTWNGKPGERHQFRCITTGSPTPKITWTGPNGSPLPHDVTPLEPNILDFSNGRSELNGDYTCTASNPIGEASDHGNVNIGPSLTVKTNPPGPKLIVTVGEPLQVKCEAFGAPGDPEPEVEWLHDPGPERGDLPDDFKPVTISEQFIRHPNVGLGNAGVYTCKGSSAHATATKNIYIEVVEPSRIATVSILGGSSQWFDQGEKGELICTATGSSLVDRLEWEKVDDQLPTDVEEHNEPGLLHFPSFKNSYAGEYRCNGYRNNEIIASAAVHVHSSANADDEPKVEIEPPRVRVVSQGDNIVLKCSVQGAENGEHFKWALLRGGSLVRQLGTEPTLEITKADPSNDFGVYRCNVEDNNGLVIGSAFTAVSVGQQDKSHAQIVKFDDKSDASFTCPIYSVPGSKVDWTYENGDLPSKAVPNGNKIEIKEFDDASAGTYVCKVSFDGNVVEGFVTAQMFVPDTIIQVLLEVSSESPQIGDRAWFDCKVTGDPSAVISWTKEGNDDLPPNAQVTGGRLLFTDLKEDNAGVYRCVAKTKAGPLQTRTVLNVGSGKRKRKHLGNRRGRRLRHRRRNAQNGPLSRKTRTTTKLFGSWF
ncbi:Basement membrane proteoglycan [Caenorhabditis elegans]|uniref:Basement membrane proteoglycan n=1 Tax=Caenorhabditis elegans TaxID=6239 RepID=H9G354_CAEEL|nr:Basement membrane proteoglycan [Caenorhabditis elegans]CCG28432.1 Basement membrane proteoglycan [Caenorhabditis elegans]|eukprot:NP_001254443.1 Basement membrane proteoglycan [Caenorhabditis elegans]